MYKKLTVFLLSSLLIISTFSQSSPRTHSKSTSKSLHPALPLKLKTMLGKNVDGAIISVEEGLQLLDSPLKIIDDKNIPFNILSYNLMYKRKGLIQNDATGRDEVAFTSIGDRFTKTPLSATWIKLIKNTLKKDEQLYFYDIIIKDRMGRKTFAPDLRLEIK